MRRGLCFFIVILVGTAMFADTQQAPSTDKRVVNPITDMRFKVHVSVSSDNQKAFIESHIKRELRALHDVEIVSWDTAEYFLTMVALEGEYTSGRKTGGISIAYCWYERNPVPKDFRNPKPPFNFPDHKSANAINKNFWDRHDKHNSFTEPRLGIRHAPTDELDDVCKRIVAIFDQAALEGTRKLNQSFCIARDQKI